MPPAEGTAPVRPPRDSTPFGSARQPSNPSHPTASVSDGTNSVAGGGWEGAFSKSKKGAPETGPNSHNQPKAKTSVRSRGKARLVTLDCMGRGDFANRTFRFESRSPLHYIPIGQHLATNVRTKILAVLTDPSPNGKANRRQTRDRPGHSQKRHRPPTATWFGQENEEAILRPILRPHGDFQVSTLHRKTRKNLVYVERKNRLLNTIDGFIRGTDSDPHSTLFASKSEANRLIDREGLIRMKRDVGRPVDIDNANQLEKR